MIVKVIVALAKEMQAARKERLHRQACADAQNMIDSHIHTSSQSR